MQVCKYRNLFFDLHFFLCCISHKKFGPKCYTLSIENKTLFFSSKYQQCYPY